MNKPFNTAATEVLVSPVRRTLNDIVNRQSDLDSALKDLVDKVSSVSLNLSGAEKDLLIKTSPDSNRCCLLRDLDAIELRTAAQVTLISHLINAIQL